MADAVRDLVVCGAATAVAYAGCYFLATRWLPRAPDVAVAGDAIFGLAYYPLLVVLAARASLALGGSAHDRWFATTAASAALGKLLVARMVVHVPYIYLKRTPAEVALRSTYVAHHGIVVLAYGAGVFRNLAHFWGAAAALCEATNVFLTVEELLLCAPAAAARLARPRAAIGLGFKATYVLLRLLLFPALLVQQRRDYAALAPADRARLGVPELVVFPAAVLLVFLLSAKWALDARRKKAD